MSSPRSARTSPAPDTCTCSPSIIEMRSPMCSFENSNCGWNPLMTVPSIARPTVVFVTVSRGWQSCFVSCPVAFAGSGGTCVLCCGQYLHCQVERAQAKCGRALASTRRSVAVSTPASEVAQQPFKPNPSRKAKDHPHARKNFRPT